MHLIREVKEVDPNFDLHELAMPLYILAEKHGALSDVLGNIGSWGDTLTDEEMLEMMRS